MDKFEFLDEEVGRGSFGCVRKCIRKADSKVLVVKSIRYDGMDQKQKELLVSEVNILRLLHHPFIVRYYDRLIDQRKTTLHVVIEYCPKGDLGALIKHCKKNDKRLEEALLWRVLSHLTVALKACHKFKQDGKIAPILHRDIKPSNVFLDGQNRIKIGDFGLAKALNSASRMATTNVGTPYYMSPEMYKGDPYNEKNDIWALGCLLYELAALRPPFVGSGIAEVSAKVQVGRCERIPAYYSSELDRLIAEMLEVKASLRPNVETLEHRIQLLESKWGFPMKEADLEVQRYRMERSFVLRERELVAKQMQLKERERRLEERERLAAQKEAVCAPLTSGKENTLKTKCRF